MELFMRRLGIISLNINQATTKAVLPGPNHFEEAIEILPKNILVGKLLTQLCPGRRGHHIRPARML